MSKEFTGEMKKIVKDTYGFARKAGLSHNDAMNACVMRLLELINSQLDGNLEAIVVPTEE